MIQDSQSTWESIQDSEYENEWDSFSKIELWSIGVILRIFLLLNRGGE